MTNSSKLAITSIGFNSPNGTGIDNFYNQINFGCTKEVIENYDPQQYLGTKGLRYLNKATLLYCNLAFQVIEERGLRGEIAQKSDRIGLYDGSDLSNIEDGFIFDFIAKTEGPDLASPMSAPNTIANASSSMMAIKANVKGPNFTVCGGVCGSLQALDIASLHISEGMTDYGILVSTEVTSKYHKAVRKGEKRNTDVSEAGEMGISLLVEPLNNAEDQGVKIYSKVIDITSGHKLLNESSEDLLTRLAVTLIKDNKLVPDVFIIGGGIQNLNPGQLRQTLNKEVSTGFPIYYPELVYGNGDNAGGFAGILYAIGLFEKKITNLLVKLDEQKLSTQAHSQPITKAIIASIDKAGYAILTYITK